MDEKLVALLRASPFATLEEAKDFLEWFNAAQAVSDWDVYRAQSAKQLADLEAAIYERDFGPKVTKESAERNDGWTTCKNA
jgi:hypothetical protein